MVNEAGGMAVEILYARPGDIWRRRVVLPPGSTVGQALEAGGLTQCFPEFADTPPVVGVYGRIGSLQQVLQSGDRIEVYRPLIFDPMESRRRRALHRQRRKAAGLSRN